MAAEKTYRYALLGIVGLVTLVAIFAIIRLPLSAPSFDDENLYGSAVATPGITPVPEQPVCGTRAAQTQSCNGPNACCGGTCVALPDCAGKSDGKIFMCGDRQMYCCNGQLSLMSRCPKIADDSGFGPGAP